MGVGYVHVAVGMGVLYTYNVLNPCYILVVIVMKCILGLKVE